MAKNRKLLWLTFLIITVQHILAFIPQTLIDEPRTQSHNDIIQEGVFRGVAQILRTKHLVNTTLTDPQVVIHDYFGSGKHFLWGMFVYVMFEYQFEMKRKVFFKNKTNHPMACINHLSKTTKKEKKNLLK